jgi:hypothetical protein
MSYFMLTEETPTFSAVIARDTSFSPGQTFLFTNVEVNTNNMYNPSNGIAEIPSDGNYVITWHALTNEGYATYPYLKVNNQYKGQTACDATGSTGVRVACGNTIVLALKKGDRIWIEEWVSNGRSTNVQAHFTSFSAWKL